MRNRRGMSGIIVAMIMIALVLAATTIVWVMVNGIIKDRIDTGSSCFKVLDKISIENRYTCYDDVGVRLRFQVSLKDINIGSLLVTIQSNSGSGESFTLTNENQTISGLTYYEDTGDSNVKLPNKNSGRTYNLSWGYGNDDPPSIIKIAPIVNGKQCETVDTLSGIDNCDLLP